MTPLVVAAGLALVVLLVAVVMAASPERAARRLLWAGLLAPFAITVSKSSAEVAAGLNPIDIARGVVPVLCLALATTRYKPPFPRRPAGAVELAMVLFIGFSVASTLWSTDARATLLKAATLGVQYLILARLIRCYPGRDEAVQALATVVHGLLLVTLFQVIFLPGLAFGGTDIVSEAGRLHSTFPRMDANPLGLVATVGVFAVFFRLGPRWTLIPSVRFLLFLGYTGVLLGTRTRTAIAFGLIFFLYVAVRQMRHNAYVLALLPVALSLGAILVLANLDGLSEFAARGQTSRSLTTLTGRTVVWGYAYRLWQLQPWEGYGFYSGHRFANISIAGQGEYGNLDNTWLEMLVDVGVIGTLFLAGAVLAAVRRAWGSRGGDSPSTVSMRLAVLGYGLCISFINPTLQQTAVGAVLIGFFLMMPVDAVRAKQPATPLTPPTLHRAAGR